MVRRSLTQWQLHVYRIHSFQIRWELTSMLEYWSLSQSHKCLCSDRASSLVFETLTLSSSPTPMQESTCPRSFFRRVAVCSTGDDQSNLDLSGSLPGAAAWGKYGWKFCHGTDSVSQGSFTREIGVGKPITCCITPGTGCLLTVAWSWRICSQSSYLALFVDMNVELETRPDGYFNLFCYLAHSDCCLHFFLE